MEEKKRTVSSTPYDDAFKTLMNDCGRLVLTLLNITFDEEYDSSYRVVFGKDEHHILMANGSYRKITGDEHFMVVDKNNIGQKEYVFECQSYDDDSMDVRLYEYASAAALEGSYRDENGNLHVPFPEEAVLYLRGTGEKVIEEKPVYLDLPDQTVKYNMRRINYLNYDIDRLFDEKLYILLPFSMFYFETDLRECSKDDGKLNSLVSTFANLRNKLDDKVRSGDLSEIEKYTIIATSNLVVEGLTKKYRNIEEGVLRVMGGKVIDYEAKDIYNAGKSEGRSEGEIFGSVKTMREFKVPDSQIAEKIIKSYNLTPEQANIYLAETQVTYGNK